MELVTVVKIVKHIYDNGFYVLFKQKPLPVYFEAGGYQISNDFKLAVSKL